MTPRYNFLALSMSSLLFMSCAGTSLPPALPEDRMQLMPTTIWPADDTNHLTIDQSPPPPVVQMPQREPVQFEIPPPKEPVKLTKRGKRGRLLQESPERIIEQANRDALVGPSKQAYLKNSVIIRYPYDQDKVYEVYTAPHSATIIRLPVGQRVASPIALKTTGTEEHPPEWAYGEFETGETKEEHQDVYSVRPLKSGLDVYVSFITLAGYSFHCRLRSFEKTSMREVTWAMPHAVPLSIPPQPTTPQQPQSHNAIPLTSLSVTYRQEASRQPQESPQATLKPPSMNIERLHTAYTIAVVGKHTPPWVPTSVFDDGTKTIVTFKESLVFTSAPALFGVHSDKSPAPLDFVPYTSENGKKLWYIVVGLYPELYLKGVEGLEVKITRIP